MSQHHSALFLDPKNYKLGLVSTAVKKVLEIRCLCVGGGL